MDAETYRQVVLEAKDRVYGYAARLLGDREEARDVAQEALVRLWEHRDGIDDAAGARYWVLRATHNLCFDRLRLRTTRPEAHDGGAVLEATPAGAPGPERAAQNGETARALDAALARLAPRDRAVLLLREVHGLSYDEIAQAAELPLGTVKALLHRARERARTLLVAAGVRP